MSRKEFIDKMALQLKEWDDQIEKLEAKAAEKKADAKLEYNEELKNLRTKKQNAQKKLDELKQSSDEAWEELKSGTEEAFSTIKNAFQTAKSKFQ